MDDDDDERPFEEQMAAAIPELGVLRAQAQLLPEEWDCETVPHQRLTARGGVAIVPKHELPDVVALSRTALESVSLSTFQI